MMASSNSGWDREPQGPARRGEIIEPGSPADVHTWRWDSGRRRSRVPWVGVFFVLFGVALLAQELVPGVAVAGSAIVLAVGVAFLVSWLTGGGTATLYIGAVLTALGLSDVLSGLGVISGPGWGRLFLGIALIAIGVVRASRHGGWGWQLIVGALLAITGGAEVADRAIPTLGELERLFWPIVLLAFGAYLVFRDRLPGRTAQR